MSFKKRLTISLIFVAIVPVLIVSLVLSERSIKTTRAQYEHTMERILDSNATNMDRALKNTYEALIQLVSTPDLISMLNSMAQGETDLNLETRVDKTSAAIRSLQNLEKDIFEQIGVYSGSTESIVISSYSYIDQNVPLFYQEVKEAAGKPLWIVVPGTEGARDLYIAAAALRPYNNQVMGIVYIKMKYDFFEQLMDSANGTLGEYLFLVGDGQLIAVSDPNLFSREKREEWDPVLTGIQEDTKEITVGKEGYLVNMKKSEVTDWALIFAGREKVLAEAALSGVGPVALAALAAVLAALLMAAGLSYSAYRPIYRLLQVFANLDRDNLGIRVEERGDSDLKQISGRMNQMMEQINRLVEETEREKEARFTAEMAALRAQINPHFLYNTLNVIKYLAVSGKKEDAEKACVCLIHLLRTSIGNNRECITLKEELSYVKNYIELVQLRVDKQFEAVDEIPEEFWDALVPKFTLQPIVENSIIHGFANGTSDNTIFFSACSRDGNLVISVTDNGRGIEAGKVQELDTMLKAKEGFDFSKVGILNVNERIRHIFGEGYGLQIISYQEEGTQVQICLPRMSEKEKSADGGIK